MKEESKTRPWAALAVAVMFVLASLVSAAPARAAEERTVIPMGRAVGIKLFSDGVMVVGFSEVAGAEGSSAPARDCGLREGDIITHINREEVDSIEEVQSVLQEVGGKPMSIRAVRDDKTVQLTAQAVQCGSDGQYKLGAWIRDSMAGIGTVTYYDPDSNTFGALGHGITDGDTAALMPFGNGAILPSTVKAVKKGSCGSAGELRGEFDLTEELGQLYANTGCGIFGTLNAACSLAEGEALPVGDASEGPAVIRSNISGDEVQEYAVEILKTIPDAPDGRELVISVTDPELIAATGGIVQGMSGSPILQNGQLVGAVTHVLLNSPQKGYGISIQRMLATAESVA